MLLASAEKTWSKRNPQYFSNLSEKGSGFVVGDLLTGVGASGNAGAAGRDAGTAGRDAEGAEEGSRGVGNDS